MTVKQAKWLNFKLAISAIVILLFSKLFTDKPVVWLLIAAGFALLICIWYIEFKYIRCPDCGRYLHRLPIDAENCPYCGTPLE